MDEYLKTLKNKTTGKYKRVVSSPLRYAGGKSAAVGLIIEKIPKNTKKIVSPFFGGGSVELALAKNLGFHVIGYDIFDLLVNYWKMQVERPLALYNILKTYKPTKEEFTERRIRLLGHWKETGPKITDPDELTAMYYFNHNMSYGPMFLGWPSSVQLTPEKYNSILEKVKNFSVTPGRVEISVGDFEEAFKTHPNEFFFCDPPYYLDGDSKMFKGLYPNCNFPIHHKGFDHKKLRDLAKSHKGGFIITYNDCSTIREWYAEFEQSFPTWQYTMAQGETRIGKNREEGTGDNLKESHEILIYCAPRL
jgi:DNA adenine methylase